MIRGTGEIGKCSWSTARDCRCQTRPKINSRSRRFGRKEGPWLSRHAGCGDDFSFHGRGCRFRFRSTRRKGNRRGDPSPQNDRHDESGRHSRCRSVLPDVRHGRGTRQRGVDMVSVSHQARIVDFSEGVQLGESDHIVEWQKPRSHNRADREASPGCRRRSCPRVSYRRRGARRGSEKAIVISTMTDPSIPQGELSDLYWRRGIVNWTCDRSSSRCTSTSCAARIPNGREGNLRTLARL